MEARRGGPEPPELVVSCCVNTEKKLGHLQEEPVSEPASQPLHELIYVALNPFVPSLWSHFSRQELYPFKTLTVESRLRAGSWDLEQKCLCVTLAL